MRISVNGTLLDVRECPDCQQLAYHTRDYPGSGLREFQCGQQHLSFEALRVKVVGKPDAPRAAA